MLDACLFLLVYQTFNYAMELGSKNFETAFFFIRFEYIDISLLGIIPMLHVLDYVNKIHLLSRWQIASLFIIPLLTNIFVWTNEPHELIWQDVTPNLSQGFTSWQADFGIWFWIQIGYTYIVLMLCYVFMTRAIINSPEISWAIFSNRYLSLMPVAREAVLLHLKDGVLVLDKQNYILDMNPASESIFEQSIDALIGRPLKQILPEKTPELTKTVKGRSYTYQVEETILSNNRGEPTWQNKIIPSTFLWTQAS